MNHHRPFSLLPALLLSLLAGPVACFDSDDLGLDELHAAADPSDLDTSAPEISLFVDGSSAPPVITSATELGLFADASDDTGVVEVELYLGEQLLVTLTEAPYWAQLIIPNADFNGSRLISAVAYDEAGNMRTDVVELVVQMPR